MSRAILLSALVFFSLPCGMASAREVCGDPFTQAGLKYRISPKLLYAIARRESGMRTMALNVDGQAYYPVDREEAVLRAAKAKSNVDVGLMQISHTLWKDRYGLSVTDLLDPFYNVEIAADILRKLMDRYPLDFLKAVARYHTGDEDVGRDYSYGVLREWVRAGLNLTLCWEEQ